jgi:hemerythrin
MKWTEAYATGSNEVDEQHKMLFLMSDQFRESLDAGHGERTYDLFIEFLSTYTQTHFTYEEECMLAHVCPTAALNKTEHCAFTKFVDKELKRFRRDGFDRSRAYSLVDTIDRWLDSHIGRVDVQLKSVMK